MQTPAEIWDLVYDRTRIAGGSEEQARADADAAAEQLTRARAEVTEEA